MAFSRSSSGKGPIFVSGADGDKGLAIVQQLVQLLEKHCHLTKYPISAGLADVTTSRAKILETMGAKLVAFDIFNHPEAAVNALQGVAKLCLLVDPLSERMKRSNAFHYGKAFIDAAKQANVEHIIFLTPFSPLDPVSGLLDPTSYRSQFMRIESYLCSQFDGNQITVLRYPGLLHQHLLVFRKYIAEHNAFPLPDKHLEITVESSNMFDIARATAFIAHSPTARHGRNAYKITGPQLLTLQEVSQRVLTGLRRDIAINLIDDIDSLKQILCDCVGNEDHVVFMLEMWGLQQQKLSGRRFEVTRDLEALTGQSGKTLNEYFEEDGVREAFTRFPSVA
ncbi:hypothetical protein DFQ28_009116 [Apophysomyces sp. BC1034]|nr:hypothetical protein DFQ30_009946 [Apophysomyces sp. BC1015]KAG0171513.1 hypothetical protein DFQ29_008797 [Apophysomyces sp. BC1021]KAG0185581.1 hypothetical protein DFQ28_009116 [Apophysomyces sp. BC1034]